MSGGDAAVQDDPLAQRLVGGPLQPVLGTDRPYPVLLVRRADGPAARLHQEGAEDAGSGVEHRRQTDER